MIRIDDGESVSGYPERRDHLAMTSYEYRGTNFMMLTRRQLLQSTASGFGYLAFAALAHEAAANEVQAAGPLASKEPHFPARAKRVIFLCMDGGPSHVDTFDYKPKLVTDDGKLYDKGGLSGAKLLAPTTRFKQYGRSGLWVSDLFPEVAKHADELCLLRGMYTDVPAHPQAFLQMHCGVFQFPRPSLGAWVLYGLGTENQNLPGFVTLSPPTHNGGSANYGSQFLPAIYQGTKIGTGAGIGSGARREIGLSHPGNIRNSRRSIAAQRAQLDFVQSLNRTQLESDAVNLGVEGMIESYELAFRMQTDLPKLLDLNAETRETQALYGIGDGRTESFARQCLLARRMVESGVRFVEVAYSGWDQHRNLREDLSRNCSAVDKPIAGLLADLKRRDLLKETLVIWGGEFGRTPTAQNSNGRDHNNKGYTLWMAGGGMKGGLSYGTTDDYGFEAVDGKVHIHDWHATILHLLGLDHENLTYRHAGREMRLTDTKGTVVKEILA